MASQISLFGITNVRRKFQSRYYTIPKMALAFLLICLTYLQKINSEFSTPPAFKLRIPRQGLNYANLVASDLLNQKMRSMQVPGVEKRIEGGGRFRLKNIQIVDFQEPINQYSLTPPSTFSWSLRNASVQIRADWWGKKRVLMLLESSGVVTANASDIDISLSAKFSRNQSHVGQPIVAYAKCVATIGQFNVEVKGGIVASLMNVFKKQASQYLKPVLERELCNRATEFLINDVNAKLATFPIKTLVYEGFLLDYSLVANPTITNDFVEIALKGRISPSSDQSISSPYNPDQLAKTHNGNRMFYAWASDTIINDFLYFAHTSNLTRYLITKNTPGAGSFLKLRCNASSNCLGNSISEISQMFPERVESAEVFLSTSKAPFVQIKDGAASLEVDGIMDLYGYIPSLDNTKRKKSIAICSINLQADLRVKVENMRLTGRVNITQFNLRILQTEIDFFTAMLVESNFPDIATPPLEKFINDRFSAGFPIPVTRGVTLIRPEIHLLSRTVQVESDVQYVG